MATVVAFDDNSSNLNLRREMKYVWGKSCLNDSDCVNQGDCKVCEKKMAVILGSAKTEAMMILRMITPIIMMGSVEKLVALIVTVSIKGHALSVRKRMAESWVNVKTDAEIEDLEDVHLEAEDLEAEDLKADDLEVEDQCACCLVQRIVTVSMKIKTLMEITMD